MKEIKAYVRVKRIDSIVRELKKAGIKEMNIIHIMAVREVISPEEQQISIELTSRYADVVKVEIVAPADRVDEIIRIIQKWGHTGQPGDGFIYISPVEEAIKIRTGVKNIDAII